jgi:tetratricopeptide (TPR) repeat protein
LENTASSPNGPKYSSKTEVEVLLELLVQLPRAKILVTSRSSPELKRILDESGATHSISRGDNASDIGRYVKFRVEKSHNLLRGFKQIDKDPCKFFGEKSNGIFLWVAIVLDILERVSSASAFLSALDELPPALNNLYDQVITRANNSGNYKWIKEVLNWTLIVQKPLSVEQMKTAVELSTGDRIFDMEDLLRSECGSLVDLVPVLGAALGQSYEVHIGHETFQAYLNETRTPSKDDGDMIFSAPRAHGTAALACLRYLTGVPNKTDNFYEYAITMWRWHLMRSIGSEEYNPGSDTVLELQTGDRDPVFPPLARDILLALYRFLTADKIDTWLEWHFLDRLPFVLPIFEAIRNCCKDVSDWYRINKEVLSDITLFPVEGTEAYTFIFWRDGIETHQTLLDPIWPRACHIFIWNTWTRWDAVSWGFRALISLRIWTTHPELRIREVQCTKDRIAFQIRKEMNRLKAYPRSEVEDLARAEQKDRSHLEAITEAGEFDEVSGVCHANLAAACCWIGTCIKDPDDAAQWFQESLKHMQEAIDEDPEGNPRYHETVGRLYQELKQEDLALDAFSRGIACDPENVSNCREEYYKIKKAILTRGDIPNYDAAIALFEEAIEEDSKNANKIYFHQTADMYKEKGDLEGARKTYRANMVFDPLWNSQWNELANTYIDKKIFRERREFDWRGYCDALAEAAVQDPSQAHSYWRTWINKAEELRREQAFSLGVEIFEYGITVTSQMQTESAVEARPNFEHRLGETYCAMCQWDSAIIVLEGALKHKKEEDTDIYTNLGEAYLSCRRHEEALTAFSKIIDEDPNWHMLHFWAAEVHYLTGQYTSAIKEYKTAIRLCESLLKKETHEQRRRRLGFGLGKIYLDLGCVYDRLSRVDQARSCFARAIPHYETYAAGTASDCGPEHGNFMHRPEGRVLMGLAWLYERIQQDDKKVEETYQKAVEVFKIVVWDEDDFLEETEALEAEQALERVRKGEPWVLPTEEEDRALRERARARTYRSNFGVNLDRPNRSRMRGRA